MIEELLLSVKNGKAMAGEVLASIRENKGDFTNTINKGDNLEIMQEMLGAGCKVDLIYIDPPFLTGKDFKNKEGVVCYSDKFNGVHGYFSYMYPRLVLMRELLAESGSIYVHCDWRVNSYMRLVLDEIFGKDNFRNEIIWHYKLGMKAKSKKFHSNCDTLFLYSRSNKFCYNEVKTPILEKKRPMLKFNSETKKAYQLKDENGKPLYITYYSELVGTMWDILNIAPRSSERLGYPTQKPEALLERIIKASSNEGDIVCDFFCGSGTTLAVAEKLGRKWVGVDNSEKAIEVSQERIAKIKNERI